MIRKLVSRLSLRGGAHLAMAAALMLGSTACSNKTSYAYIDVHVQIDPTTISSNQLALVTNCEAQILGQDVNESISLRCRENRVPYDVGSFEWTTDHTGGTLQIVVRVLSANLVLVGETTSPPISVAAGKRTKIDLLVVGVGTSGGTPDAGTDAEAPAANDAAIEAPAAADAAAEHPSDAAPATDVAPAMDASVEATGTADAALDVTGTTDAITTTDGPSSDQPADATGG